MLKIDTKQRIKDLEHIIETLDTLYHDKGEDCINPITGEIVLDNEYDALKQELLTLCPKSKIFQTVTSSKEKLLGKRIVHDPPMTSINKCNGSEEEKIVMLQKWFRDCFAHFDAKNMEFCMSYKHDGLALSCEYEKGELKRVGLRSKSGKDGINVTNKAKYIKGIPQKLSLPITCTIRGEVETPISTFKKVSEDLGADAKANPRAHTAGSMNHKTAEKMKDRGLVFTAYNILKLDNPPYRTEMERAEWANKTLGFNFVKTVSFDKKLLETFESQHRRLNFMVDGVVISVNNLEDQKDLGQSGNKDTGNPKGKIAWKFADEIKSAIVKDIVWQTGRTGNITPVLIFDGIQLEGTTVSKCTAHNLGVIKTNNLGIGSKVEIIKSGKIIPKLHKVINAKGSPNIPKNCPSCGDDLLEVNGYNEALSLNCDNTECPAQNIKNLNHWMKILGVKGIAEKNIEKLIDAGVVQKPGDFYRLTVDKLIKVGITKRTAMLIVARVWMVNSPEQIKDEDLLNEAIKGHSSTKIKTTIAKFFAAFGMKNAGREAGRILEQEIGSWNKIKTLTLSELESFDGIGPTMAQEITLFFQNNKKIVEDVEQYFRFEVPVSSGKLKGKTFVLSGSLDGGKSKWKSAIEGKGGIIKSSVGRKVNFLVAGSGSGSKSDKAKELKIPIITVQDLEKMLG